MSNELIVLMVISVYMLGMIGIGLWSSKRITGLADYFVAGRNVGFWFSLAAMFSVWFGACSSVGTAGTVYSQGLRGVISDPFGASISLLLAGIFYVALFRKLKFFTVVDIFGRTYSKKSEVFAALLMIPVYIGWLGAQIVAIGTIFQALTGYDANLGMIIGAIVVLTYTYAGGMWAVTITDFYQAIILIIGIVAVFFFILQDVGGIAAVYAQTPGELLNFLPAVSSSSDIISWIGQWLIMGLGCIVGQDLIQRSLSSRTEKTAKWSTIGAGLMYFVMGLVVITIGLAGRILVPDLADPESLIPTLALQYFPPLLVGLFISALLSAIMSSADGALIATTSLLIHNVIHKVFPKLHEKDLLKWSKVITVVATILAMIIALYVGQVYNLMINSWTTLLVAIFVPVTVALFWEKYASVEACWISMIAGLSTWILFTIIQLGAFIISNETMATLYQASFYGFFASVVSYALVTLIKFGILKK